MELVAMNDTTTTLLFVENGIIFYVEIMGREVSVYDYWTYFDESDNPIQPTLHTDFKVLFNGSTFIELYYKCKGEERQLFIDKESENLFDQVAK